MTSIVWFRQDLRAADNPALAAAAALGPIVPVFIMDDSEAWPPGLASRWWLHHSLEALGKTLGGLTLLRGKAEKLLPDLVTQTGATAVFWNRCYEPAAIARDTALKASLQKLDIEVKSFNANLLHEPWEIKTGSGGPYKVYTPYWRASLRLPKPQPVAAPKIKISPDAPDGDRLQSWKLLPTKPNWAKGWEKLWQPGEEGAMARFDEFMDALADYPEDRDRPDRVGTSRLSPHLHWGEISPRQIFQRIGIEAEKPRHRAGADKFLSEIGWREFAHHLLYHFPTLPDANWRSEFDAYPWHGSKADIEAWQRGMTGYPLVDAGMRELWQTGWMHNRVRMIVASFLIKHLRVDWRRGEEWFWDTLLDADLANNAAGWQWVAGSGADASPYFRIFNPIAQGEKFDPDGEYVRRWCPELKNLPSEFIHAPFSAPKEVLKKAGVELGKTYPSPIVDHDKARKAALAGYEKVRNARS